MTLKEFQAATHTRKDLRYVDPSTHHIHHKNENHKDNSPDNLECLTASGHRTLHSRGYENFEHGKVSWSQVASILLVGRKKTYDIVCQDPHRNFVANGIVVHNCGKTAIPKAVCAEEGVNLLVIRTPNVDEGVLQGYPGQIPGEPGVVDLHIIKRYKTKLEEFIANGRPIAIFFDEANRAKDHIIQNVHTIIDIKAIANFQLPVDRTMFIVSINPATDAHTVRDIIGKEAALNRRFEVYGMKADAKSFVDFMISSVPDAHPLVVDYIRNNPDHLMGLEHMSMGKKYACPAIYKTFSRQLTAMEKAGVSTHKLSKHSTKVRRLNAAFGTGEGKALLAYIMDHSRRITPTMILENYDKVQPIIRGELSLVLGDDGGLPIDAKKLASDGSGEEALDMGQLSKLASDVASYVGLYKPDLIANREWAINLARFMDDLPKDPLKMFLEKLHINTEATYSEKLVSALSNIDEFKSASHKAHKYTRDAAKATEEAK